MLDADVFAELVESTQRSVRSYIAGLGVPLSEVDDIAQEAYLEYFRHPDKLPAGVPAKAWIKGIARNRVLHWFRAQGRRGIALEHIADVLIQPEAAETHGPEAEALHGCLERLSARHREILELSYGQGLNSIEVAERIGSTSAAVRVALHRLRESLYECLRRKVVGEALP